jgi:hypothetical protein
MGVSNREHVRIDGLNRRRRGPGKARPGKVYRYKTASPFTGSRTCPSRAVRATSSSRRELEGIRVCSDMMRAKSDTVGTKKLDTTGGHGVFILLWNERLRYACVLGADVAEFDGAKSHA